MPLSSSTVGRETDPTTTQIDARWLMAYAAALGDMLPCYIDTASQDGIVGHPLFSVGPDWPVFLNSHGLEGNEAKGINTLKMYPFVASEVFEKL